MRVYKRLTILWFITGLLILLAAYSYLQVSNNMKKQQHTRLIYVIRGSESKFPAGDYIMPIYQRPDWSEAEYFWIVQSKRYDDIITGIEGNDIIYGSYGNDIIYGISTYSPGDPQPTPAAIIQTATAIAESREQLDWNATQVARSATDLAMSATELASAETSIAQTMTALPAFIDSEVNIPAEATASAIATPLATETISIDELQMSSPYRYYLAPENNPDLVRPHRPNYSLEVTETTNQPSLWENGLFQFLCTTVVATLALVVAFIQTWVQLKERPTRKSSEVIRPILIKKVMRTKKPMLPQPTLTEANVSLPVAELYPVDQENGQNGSGVYEKELPKQ